MPARALACWLFFFFSLHTKDGGRTLVCVDVFFFSLLYVVELGGAAGGVSRLARATGGVSFFV